MSHADTSEARATIHTRPRVSVVTPVHNGSAFLKQCIESVLRQTYANWDYTIVNNCSTDTTRAIAEEYAKTDARIRVLTTHDFLDAIASHNMAARQISPASAYCKFVEADDWLFPECLERMVDMAEAHPSASIVGSFTLEGDHVACDGLPYDTHLIRGHEVCRQTLFGSIFVFGSPTSLLYRADLVRQASEFFPGPRPDADTTACFRYLEDTDFAFVHQVLSYTRVHHGAISERCRRLNTYSLDVLRRLVRFGPRYLTPDEVDTTLQRRRRQYYRFLAASALEFRELEFWKFHISELQAMGQPLRWGKLTAAVFMAITDILLNPKWAIEEVWRRAAGGLSCRNRE
jgi:glycosyltransferase involved in cell wall biosynthesis